MAVVNFPLRMRVTISRMDESERVSVAQRSLARPLLATSDSQRGCVNQVICDCGNDWRKAATAGKVCTMSPREPRRTTKKRGSGILILAKAFQQRARGVLFRIAHDGDADAEACGGGAFGHGVGGIVGALGVHVRPQLFQ